MKEVIKLELLADNLDAHKVVARWYFDEWLGATPGATIERVEAKLSKATKRDSAPLMVLAKLEGKIIGAAELKIREMDIFPQYKHWLGGVYVDKTARGRGIATVLTMDIIERAKKAGISRLYLQTENLSGGLYTACGFRGLEKVEYKGHHVLVMVAKLSP